MAIISEAFAIALQHHRAGRRHAAEQIYRQILAVDPEQPNAIHLLGVLAYEAGRYDVAIEYIGRAIRLKGTAGAFHNNLGNAFQAQGKLEEAVACFRRALDLKPDYAEAHNNLGNAFQAQGKLDEAVACYCLALEKKPYYAEPHNNLGNAFKAEGKLDEAVACYHRALEQKPDYAEAHNNLGNAFKNQGKLEEAVACFRRALDLKPDYAEARNNLGNAFQDQGKRDEAVACYRRALDLKPDYAEAHDNLGHVFLEQGELDEAVACYRRSLELKPDFAEAHNNLGSALRTQGKLEEAVACYGRALELRPGYDEAYFNRSMVLLLQGNWEQGWPDYEYRRRIDLTTVRRFDHSPWNGESLAGRSILLQSEQGFGDTIQFVRYAALVKRRGATVMLECQKPLLPLLQSCSYVDQWVGQGEELPNFDVQAALLSLPGILRTSVQDIPAQIPYLSAAPALVARWSNKLDRLDGFKIGIHWQGSRAYRGDRYRSFPLRHFARLAEIPGVHLISLQKGAGTEQLTKVDFPVLDLAAELDQAFGTFMDTAAVMMNLDLVITSDSSVAHLAGALGVPVWVVLPLVPDWRWLLDRADSPWYPTMRLFRQSHVGDWEVVFQHIELELAARVQ